MASTKAATCLLAVALAVCVRAEEPAAEVSPAAEVKLEGGAVAADAESAPAAAPDGTEAQPFGESISVTATRSPRRTRDVPQAIAVVGKEQIEDSIVFNVKDVLAGTPGVLVETKNGGYDSRLLIRGAGLKASYGVREIMILRDGVPLTDPDSFSRLDWIDMQDIERIEISKGPGNLFSPGSAGGALQIISRSVFDPGADMAEAGLGTLESVSAHLRTSAVVGGGNALALTASFRQQDNPWRLWNEFDSRQLSLKHGVELGETATLESEVAYTEADLQLPGAMDRALFDRFVETGVQRETSEPWRHSGRYSKSLFFNSKYEQRLGAFTLKPRLYFNQWKHLHPVTGAINDTRDWTRTVGTDLEAHHAHEVAGIRGTLVAGVTAKAQWNDDTRKYQYRDVVLNDRGGIDHTLSDAQGDLMEIESQRNVLLGLFAQESIQPHERVLVDVGLRFDRSDLRIRTDVRSAYDYRLGSYQPVGAVTLVDKTFDLPAPKAGLSVRVTRALSLYGSAARASQVPSDGEVDSNPSLTASVTKAYEVGAKLRARFLTLDLAAYRMDVTDEIVAVVLPNRRTDYQNAGETEKLGVEAAASVRPLDGLEVGASYAYADYEYVRFTERGADGTTASRSGNRLPFVPSHQYGAFASWRHSSGLRLRAQTSSWGRYWLDNANTETYPGYRFVTSLGAAWRIDRHEVVLDVENVLDERYAMQVQKDTTGRVTYAAGSPRAIAFGYRFHP
jgi:iron complex outermembrane receptor protein